jgi:hypothetical protein
VNVDALLRLGCAKQSMPGLEADIDVTSGSATAYLRLQALDDAAGRRVLAYSSSSATKESLLVVPPKWWTWTPATNVKPRGAIDPAFELPGTPLLLGDLLVLEPAQHVIAGAVRDTVGGVSCLAVTLDPVTPPVKPPARRTIWLALDGPREGLPMLVREFDVDGTTRFRTVTQDDWKSLDGTGGAWLARQRVITDHPPFPTTSFQVTRAALGGIIPTDFSVGHLPF